MAANLAILQVFTEATSFVAAVSMLLVTYYEVRRRCTKEVVVAADWSDANFWHRRDVTSH